MWIQNSQWLKGSWRDKTAQIISIIDSCHSAQKSSLQITLCLFRDYPGTTLFSLIFPGLHRTVITCWWSIQHGFFFCSSIFWFGVNHLYNFENSRYTNLACTNGSCEFSNNSENEQTTELSGFRVIKHRTFFTPLWRMYDEKTAQSYYPHDPNKQQSTQQRHLIQGDMSGKQYLTSSLKGSLYYILYKDDATTYCSVHFARHKSEALLFFKQVVNLIKCDSGYRVLALRIQWMWPQAKLRQYLYRCFEITSVFYLTVWHKITCENSWHYTNYSHKHLFSFTVDIKSDSTLHETPHDTIRLGRDSS